MINIANIINNDSFENIIKNEYLLIKLMKRLYFKKDELSYGLDEKIRYNQKINKIFYDLVSRNLRNNEDVNSIETIERIISNVIKNKQPVITESQAQIDSFYRMVFLHVETTNSISQKENYGKITSKMLNMYLKKYPILEETILKHHKFSIATKILDTLKAS